MIHRLGRHIGGNAVAYIALVVAVAGSGGSYAVAATAHHSSRKSRPTTIAACVGDRSGVLVLDRSKRCGRGHHKLTWAIKGPKGATGPAGAPAPSIYAAVDVAATAQGAQPIIEKGLTVQRTGVGLYAVSITAPTCSPGYNIPVVTPTSSYDYINGNVPPPGAAPTAYIAQQPSGTQFTIQTGYTAAGSFSPEDVDFNVLDTCLTSGKQP